MEATCVKLLGMTSLGVGVTKLSFTFTLRAPRRTIYDEQATGKWVLTSVCRKGKIIIYSSLQSHFISCHDRQE